jgi:hypothetical protein
MTHSRPSDTAFQATFSDFRLVRGRKCCQLIFEVPIEASNNALEVLGGIPNPEKEIWVGIARINKQHPRVGKKDIWRASADCAYLCHDMLFQKYMGARNENECAELIRNKLEIASRSQIDRDQAVAQKWSLMKVEYLEWLEETTAT